MQQGRVSTIRFNEWICVCAQYEKAVARLGRQVYQGYSRGLVEDYGSIELCKEIAQAFADSKRIRAEMEEELERDALHGLSAEEAKLAEEVVDISPGAKLVQQLKLRFTKLAGRRAVNSELQSYRNRVRDLSRDLGLRALAAHEKEPILKVAAHARLCNLALKLDEDSNKKWEEIVNKGSEKGGGLSSLSFHTIAISFVANFANFSRNTALGKMLLKFFKYDSKEEEQKLTKQFEGTKTAVALEAQMAEVEEPDLDIGRELETLERDYLEASADWTLPGADIEEAWVPNSSDTWTSELEAVPAPPATSASAATQTAPSPPPPSPARKPQVLRQRAQTDAFKPTEIQAPVAPKSVNSAQPPTAEPEPWAPPAAVTRIGQSFTKDPEPETEDWAAGGFEEEDPFRPEPAVAPRLGGGSVPAPPVRSTDPVPTPAPPLRSTDPVPTPAPPVRSADPAPTPAPPPIDRPKPPSSLPPLPPLPVRSLDVASEPVAKTPIPISVELSTPSDDPLLRLLRNDSAPDPDGDDLLPAFLRERDDDPVGGGDSYIPELPASLEGDSGLKILPFGSSQKRDDDGEPEVFIPQMPDL